MLPRALNLGLKNRQKDAAERTTKQADEAAAVLLQDGSSHTLRPKPRRDGQAGHYGPTTPSLSQARSGGSLQVDGLFSTTAPVRILPPPSRAATTPPRLRPMRSGRHCRRRAATLPVANGGCCWTGLCYVGPQRPLLSIRWARQLIIGPWAANQFRRRIQTGQ